MTIAVPSASKIESGPSDSVTRVVVAFSVPRPFAPAWRLGTSPMWNGWFASGSVLPAGPGSKWPPAAVKSGSHFPIAWRCTPCMPGFSPLAATVMSTTMPVPILRSVRSAVPVIPSPLMSACAVTVPAARVAAGACASPIAPAPAHIRMVVYILARVMSSSSRDCRSAISTMRKLILFDIDGTLVLTGGAGLRAMNRACADIAGNAEALSGIPVAGRTDRVILADVVSRLGRTLDDRLLDHLRERYLVHLRDR